MGTGLEGIRPVRITVSEIQPQAGTNGVNPSRYKPDYELSGGDQRSVLDWAPIPFGNFGERAGWCRVGWCWKAGKWWCHGEDHQRTRISVNIPTIIQRSVRKQNSQKLAVRVEDVLEHDNLHACEEGSRKRESTRTKKEESKRSCRQITCGRRRPQQLNPGIMSAESYEQKTTQRSQITWQRQW